MKTKCLINSWICFIIHFLIEVICFTIVMEISHNNVGYAVLVAILYDVLAFYPQLFVGVVHEKYPLLNIPIISSFLMFFGIILYICSSYSWQYILAVCFIALGNAFLHDCCAIQTTLLSEGTLFPTALFVGGGSFGVAVGTYLADTGKHNVLLLVAMMLIIILLLITNESWLISDYKYPKFNVVNKDCKIAMVMTMAFTITAVRACMSYVIPISWKKEVWQMFLLFFMMGFGKIFGGYLSDKFGTYKVGIYSILISIPFLIFGENLMVVSIIGVFLFSFTMSITYGMFLSVYNNNPGFAFGLTTLALGFGVLIYVVLPKFSVLCNIMMIIILSLLCAYGFKLTLRKE